MLPSQDQPSPGPGAGERMRWSYWQAGRVGHRLASLITWAYRVGGPDVILDVVLSPVMNATMREVGSTQQQPHTEYSTVCRSEVVHLSWGWLASGTYCGRRCPIVGLPGKRACTSVPVGLLLVQ